jgi:hypothetical protein
VQCIYAQSVRRSRVLTPAATWESDGTWGLVADTSNDRIRKLVVATDPEPEPEPEPEPVQCKESDPCFYQSAAVVCKAARL